MNMSRKFSSNGHVFCEELGGGQGRCLTVDGAFVGSCTVKRSSLKPECRGSVETGCSRAMQMETRV